MGKPHCYSGPNCLCMWLEASSGSFFLSKLLWSIAFMMSFLTKMLFITKVHIFHCHWTQCAPKGTRFLCFILQFLDFLLLTIESTWSMFICLVTCLWDDKISTLVNQISHWIHCFIPLSSDIFLFMVFCNYGGMISM